MKYQTHTGQNAIVKKSINNKVWRKENPPTLF